MFCFKQKTAYELRMSYWSADVCSSDLHHHREEPGHECARLWIAREEAVEIARAAVEIADEEPGEVVEDVVQPGDDQQPVEHPVEEQPDLARADDERRERIHARIDRGVEPAEHEREPEPSDPRQDRHESPSAAKGEIGRAHVRNQATNAP